MNRTLSPKELARAVDVSESSLKRWTDSGTIQATRTAGGHRRIALGEAIRFIRESHLELVRPEILGIRDLEKVPADPGETSASEDRLLEYLSQGDTESARGLIMWRFMQGESVAELCDGPINLAMEELGEAWKSRPDGIFLEHRATDICMQALDQLRLLAEPVDGAPVVIGGAPQGDPYILPSMMAATCLQMEGLQVVNLGPQTPAASLISAAQHYEVSLIWLSLTSNTPTRAGMERYVQELTSAFPDEVAVMIGGRTGAKVRHLKSAQIHHGSSMAELVAFARGRFSLG